MPAYYRAAPLIGQEDGAIQMQAAASLGPLVRWQTAPQELQPCLQEVEVGPCLQVDAREAARRQLPFQPPTLLCCIRRIWQVGVERCIEGGQRCAAGSCPLQCLGCRTCQQDSHRPAANPNWQWLQQHTAQPACLHCVKFALLATPADKQKAGTLMP